MRENFVLATSNVAAGWTWFNFATGKLAVIGGDAVIWIPILIQILSFPNTLLQERKEWQPTK